MRSAHLAERMCALLDRSISQLERSISAIENDVPKSSGLGFLPQQMMQLSMAVGNMRKEERETASKPLEKDKPDLLTPEQKIAKLAEMLSDEEIEQIKKVKEQNA